SADPYVLRGRLTAWADTGSAPTRNVARYTSRVPRPASRLSDPAFPDLRINASSALKLCTRDALLNYHAGMIAHARGDNAAARTHLETALAINPHFSILHAAETRETLAALGE
ncbi:MAG: hypothetical protein WEC79_08880, partial [Thermomicrobiales bacterium]